MTTQTLRRFYWHWHVEIGLAVLFLGVVLLAAALVSTRSDVSREATRGAQAYTAICVLRSDLHSRVLDDIHGIQRSQAFLRSHPNGLLGVTAVQIRASIAAQQKSLTNERRTIRSLAALRC